MLVVSRTGGGSEASTVRNSNVVVRCRAVRRVVSGIALVSSPVKLKAVRLTCSRPVLVNTVSGTTTVLEAPVKAPSAPGSGVANTTAPSRSRRSRA